MRKKSQVLVIEDANDIRFFLKGLLENTYDVALSESGSEGLKAAKLHSPPDIILLDVMLPDINGYEVLKDLRNDPLTAHIPVIFLTILNGVEEERKGLDLGATDYVTKPISAPILLARIRVHLEHSFYTKRLKDLSEQLSHYLAPQVYRSLFEGSRQASIQTQRKKLTVLFADIKNFTALTAQWQPEEITLVLNSYFGEMSQIAEEYGATLDKFIGDAIVMFFGDPHTNGVREDAIQCVKMAIAMQKRMKVLEARWKDMGINKAFEIRIGINTGYCDVGNFGSDLRMDYTIIGREVNLAARIEQAAEPNEILISEETYALIHEEISAYSQNPILAKGFNEPIAIYSVHPSQIIRESDSEKIKYKLPGISIEVDSKSLTAPKRIEVITMLQKMVGELQANASSLAVDTLNTAIQKQGIVLPKTIPGLDITVGLSRAAGLQNLYISMLQHFVEERRDITTRIRECVDKEDDKGAMLLTHSLRGVSEQIGATQIPALALALEIAIEQKQARNTIDKLLKSLESALQELIQALDH